MTEELKRKLSNKSPTFWEGYDAGGVRQRNPYGCNLVEGEPSCLKASQEWNDGWLTKFYGETV